MYNLDSRLDPIHIRLHSGRVFRGSRLWDRRIGLASKFHVVSLRICNGLVLSPFEAGNKLTGVGLKRGWGTVNKLALSSMTSGGSGIGATLAVKLPNPHIMADEQSPPCTRADNMLDFWCNRSGETSDSVVSRVVINSALFGSWLTDGPQTSNRQSESAKDPCASGATSDASGVWEAE